MITIMLMEINKTTLMKVTIVILKIIIQKVADPKVNPVLISTSTYMNFIFYRKSLVDFKILHRTVHD